MASKEVEALNFLLVTKLTEWAELERQSVATTEVRLYRNWCSDERTSRINIFNIERQRQVWLPCLPGPIRTIVGATCSAHCVHACLLFRDEELGEPHLAQPRPGQLSSVGDGTLCLHHDPPPPPPGAFSLQPSLKGGGCQANDHPPPPMGICSLFIVCAAFVYWCARSGQARVRRACWIPGCAGGV